MTYCARCRRPLTREPVIVAGKGYGTTCATKVGGDLLAPKPRAAGARPRRRQRNAAQLALEAAA